MVKSTNEKSKKDSGLDPGLDTEDIEWSKWGTSKNQAPTKSTNEYNEFIKQYKKRNGLRISTITVSKIKNILEWIKRQPFAMPHPILQIGSTHGDSIRRSLFLSWMLIVEYNCNIKAGKDPGEWFILKYADVQRYAGLRTQCLTDLVKEIKALGLIETKSKGIPAMKHYKINHELLYIFLHEFFITKLSIDAQGNRTNSSSRVGGITDDEI